MGNSADPDQMADLYLPYFRKKIYPLQQDKGYKKLVSDLWVDLPFYPLCCGNPDALFTTTFKIPIWP